MTDLAYEENLFAALSMLADHYGWELSKRDPGPESLTTVDETLQSFRRLAGVRRIPAPICDWPESRIKQSTAETQRLRLVLENERVGTCDDRG